MSFYEMTAAEARGATSKPSKSAKGWFGRFLFSMQYGRMCQALNGLSESQLQQIGITRADIPHYARKCVLGDDG